MARGKSIEELTIPAEYRERWPELKVPRRIYICPCGCPNQSYLTRPFTCYGPSGAGGHEGCESIPFDLNSAARGFEPVAYSLPSDIKGEE